MVYKALIVGLTVQDAGKTSFALALLSYLREEGFDVCGFKPRAGNNVWYDYDVVHEALSQGRLYGKDAQRLRSASTFSSQSDTTTEEFINPVHRLWAEPTSIDPISQVPHFILDRITLWLNDGVRNIVVENDALPVEHKGNEALFSLLRAHASGIYHVRDLKMLNTITKEYYNRAVALAYKKMLEQHDYLVIESYSDIALPWNGLKELDIVIGVKPGLITVYDPERYLAAVRLSAPTYSQEAASMTRILEFVKPLKVVTVPPFRSEELVQGLKEHVHLLL